MTEQYTAPVNLEGVEADYDLYRHSRASNGGWSCACGVAHYVPKMAAEIRKLRADLGQTPKGGPGDVNLEFVTQKFDEYFRVRGSGSTKEAALKQFMADVAPAMMGEIRRRRRQEVNAPSVAVTETLDKVAQPPADVQAVVETLRTVNGWIDHAPNSLVALADDVAQNWKDSGSCPVCQETWCDAGCPLKSRRDRELIDAALASTKSNDGYGSLAELVERLVSLQKGARKLAALEAFGVDNWDGYADAMQSLDNPGVIG